MRSRSTTTLVAILAAASLVLAACESGRPAPPPAPAPPAPAAHADHDHEAAGPKPVPPNGKPLFAFMLKEIPQLVDKVPCVCCPYTIGQCYRGACPPDCGPCNLIGRDVYAWHHEGLGDEEILDRVAQKYGVRRPAR